MQKENLKINKYLKITLKILLFIISVLLLIYVILVLFGNKIETEFTFIGKNVDKQNISTNCPNDLLNYEEINIDDGNGNNINGLYLKGEGDKIVYYFHGNGGPINCFLKDIKYINDLGYSVIAYDYPGYGKSTGYPYKQNVDNFSDKFYNFIKNQKNISDNNLVLWGFSIGTAVATDFASKNNFDKLILFAPFSSRYDLANYYLGFPVQKFLFLKNSYDTEKLAKDINKNVLIVHGNNDNIIPLNQGKSVYNNFVGKKYFIELQGEGHNSIISNFGNSLTYIIKNFVDLDNLNIKNNYLLIDKKLKNNLEFNNKNDVYSDDSIQKFVTSTVSFNNKEYYPNDMISIGSKYVSDMKGGNQKLRKDAKESLDSLGKAFYEKFGKKIGVVSAFRSYAYQVNIKANGCPDNFCAKAGFSEHQTGLVVDIFEASDKNSWYNNGVLMNYYKWLSENAHLYGFHNTYQKGLNIDGYEVEPWHWRYLGVELATYLFDNKLTIAEYYNLKKLNNNLILNND